MTLPFDLTPRQKEVRAIFATGAKFFLVYGGSRCVSGDTILDGHTKTIAQLAHEGRRIKVMTSHGWQEVDAPFRKGETDLLRIETDCGKSVEVTPDHRFWDGLAWVAAKDLAIGDALAVARLSAAFPRASNSERNPSMFRKGVRRWMRKLPNSQDRYSIYHHQCDERPRHLAERGLAYRASLHDALERIPDYLRAAARGLGIHADHQPKPALVHSQTDLSFSHQPTMGGFPWTDRRGGLTARAVAQTCEWFLQRLEIPLAGLSRLRPAICDEATPHSCDGQFGPKTCVPKSDDPCDSGYLLSRVRSITRTAKKGYYCLRVPGCEHYFANGMMHHNSGKTFFIIYAIITRALKAPGSRHVVFRNDGVDARQSIGNETIPAVLSLAFPGLDLKWKDQDGYFEFPNGSQLWLAGLKDKARLDKVLGKEFATIYLNEASQITLSAFSVVQTRLAQSVLQVDGVRLPLRFYVDLNPTVAAHWTYQIWINGIHPEGNFTIPDHAQNYRHITINPADNASNLPADYLDSLRNLPERMRRRFFEGAFTADDDNALWRRSYIKIDEAPDLARIVVSVDPATTNNAGSDETGLIVAATGADGRGYVLADESGKFRPEEWARRAVSLFDTYGADAVVAEVNQGGDMVESMIKAAAKGRTIPVRKVTATRAKHVRAEPVAALYEQGKVRHARDFPELVDQMCAFTIGFDRAAQGYSPDRVDALVWAFTDLFPGMVRKDKPRVLQDIPVAMPMARR